MLYAPSSQKSPARPIDVCRQTDGCVCGYGNKHRRRAAGSVETERGDHRREISAVRLSLSLYHSDGLAARRTV
jgi:hypothetical protein